MDNLGDRIKKYEKVSNHTLTPNSCAFIRVDGKSFHTYTKHWYFNQKYDAPFSDALATAMQCAMVRTAKEMQGFKLAYHQSDEVTFAITDFDSYKTEGWFGYKVNKLVSITASMFTYHFNSILSPYLPPAFFDARAFTVPLDDAPNVFVWRQKDWERNCVQMLARYHFSHKELHKKNRFDIIAMLEEKEIFLADLLPHQLYGTFSLPDNEVVSRQFDYSEIRKLITKEL